MSSTVTGLLRQGLRLAAQPLGPALNQRGLHVSASQNKMFPVNSDGRIACTLIPGDGVGPELMDATQEVLKAIGVPIDFETFHLSEIQHGISANLEEVTKSIEKNGIALKGVIAVPDASFDGNLMNLNQTFRKSLDLYASVVKVRSLAGVKTRHPNIDMVIIREQVEGEYSALEHESVPGVVECLKVVTKQRSRRIAKFAFDYATRHQRGTVTAVHKANIMKLGDGLFLRSCEEVAELYPNIKFEKMIVDNTTMQMVSKPQQFDVMVMPNLYGNIIDNLATGLVGGAGLVAGASYSADVAVFEPGARHTFDEGVGRNVANPTAMLLSAAKLLEHVGLDNHAKKIKLGVDKVLRAGKVRTRDLGGHSSTRDFARAVVSSI